MISNRSINGLILLVGACFGIGFPLIKDLLVSVDPRAVVCLRMFFSALLFWPLGWSRWPAQAFLRKEWVRLFAAALTGVVINQSLFVLGLQRTTPAHSVIINAGIPVFTLLLAGCFGFEQISGRKLIGMILAISGIFYLIQPHTVPWGDQSFQGDLMTVGNALSYSTYLLIAPPLSKRHSAFTISALVFTIAFLLFLPFGLMGIIATPWASLEFRAWGELAYAIIGMTLIPYGLIAWLLRHADSSRVAQNNYVQPIIALLVARIFFGDPLTGRIAGATALVLAGVMLANVRTQRLRQS